MCERVTLKKYTSRPSPPYHAGECKGKVLKGNNGLMYKSVERGGIYTWKPLGKTLKKNKTTYVVTDNGLKPWIVEDFPRQKKAIIYRNGGDNVTEIVDPVKVSEMKYLALWPSSDSSAFGDWNKGNTVLIQKSKNTFVLVYRAVSEFKILDQPVKYMSPIGNSDVPYPYLIGTEYVYFLVDNGDFKYVSKEHVDLTKDVYSQLWAINEFKNAEPLKSTPLKDKILIK
jgi:hypothetical protein